MGQSLLEPARTFPWVSAHFHSAPFIADFSERAEFPFRGQICKRAEQVGDSLEKNLLVNAEQKQQGAEVSGGAERRFPPLGSHLLSYQAGCQAVMAPERCSAVLLWRMGPAEICLPSALLKHSSSSLILLITPALSHTRSGFTFWLYLLHTHSLEPRAILKPSRQPWCPQDFSCASQALQRWSLRMTHTKLLFSSPAVQCRS